MSIPFIHHSIYNLSFNQHTQLSISTHSSNHTAIHTIYTTHHPLFIHTISTFTIFQLTHFTMVFFHFSSNTTLSHFILHHLLFIILHFIHSNSTSIVLITSHHSFILPFHSIPYSHFIPFIQYTILILITSITTIIHPFHSTHHSPFIPFTLSIHNTLFVIPIHMFSYYLNPSLS